MRFAFGLLLVLLLAACADKKACKLHSDCSEAERCVNFECTVLCRTDRDCEGFGSCISGECSIGGVGGGTASGGGAGGGGGTPVDAGIDAGPQDAGSPDAGFDAGPEDAGFDAGPPDAGTTDAGFDAGLPDAGNGLGQYGDTCTRATDCATGLCIGNAATGMAMCTVVCASESACDQGHACLPVQSGSGTINLCIPSDSGRPCSSGMGSSCFAGLCLLHPASTSLSVCATPCETSRACPSGFSCSVVQVGSQMQKVCSPVGPQCSAQGNSNQCISRWCATTPQTPSTGICTGSCASALDCPTGWACGLDDDGVNLFARCQPVGMPCTVNGSGLNSCLSKSCAQGTPQGDYCTALCMDLNFNPEPSRCPANWTCVNAGTTADPLWACEQ